MGRLWLSVFFLKTLCLLGETYFVDPNAGSDANSGLSESAAWKTLLHASERSYEPGDTILLKSDRVHQGKLALHNVSGSASQPVVIGAYPQGERATIDSKGYFAGVEIVNSRYVEVRDLAISADGGITVDGGKRDERFGVYVGATEGGTISDVHMLNLYIHTIYPELDTEHEGKNPTTYVGTAVGIHGSSTGIHERFSVQNCRIENVGFKAVEMKRIQHVQLLNNYMENIGGPALQPSRVVDLVVRGNTVNGSGQYTDERMHGRGSGIWPWGSQNVLIENNHFMYARGRADSCGAHIDFNCSNVIIQYNFSYDNEGGFVEILGNNHNCSYRYNISVNDGTRKKSGNGYQQNGHTIWASGFVGTNNEQHGPYNSYIYNNTIYLDADKSSDIAVANTTRGLLVANNIFYIAGTLLNGIGLAGSDWDEAALARVLWDHNLYHRIDALPDSLPFSDDDFYFGDPEFLAAGAFQPEDYIPQNEVLIMDRGIYLHALPEDELGLVPGLSVTEDFFGNPIIGRPDFGAVELGGVPAELPVSARFATLPTLIKADSVYMSAEVEIESGKYAFEELSGNMGGISSDWSEHTSFVNGNLLPNTTYSYRVGIAVPDESTETGLLVLHSDPAEVKTLSYDPFKSRILFSETFAGYTGVDNKVAPYLSGQWYMKSDHPWEREGQPGSVDLTTERALRIGWGYDEVVVNYYLPQKWDKRQQYVFSGYWKIENVLDTHEGLIVGMGEFDPVTGELIRSLKEEIVGKREDVNVGDKGIFSLTLSSEELQQFEVNEDRFVGVYIHHDDDGVLRSDTDTLRNDVYAVGDLKLELISNILDEDGDGLPNDFESAVGLNPNDPVDAASDLDGDRVSNLNELKWGSDPADINDYFRSLFEVVTAETSISIPARFVLDKRVYILEYKSRFDVDEPWVAVDAFYPTSGQIGQAYELKFSSENAGGWLRVRVEWSL